jgi:hypothetical protein
MITTEATRTSQINVVPNGSTSCELQACPVYRQGVLICAIDWTAIASSVLRACWPGRCYSGSQSMRVDQRCKFTQAGFPEKESGAE